ncbi:MAG: alpha-2-macroglobulin family protein [Chitinophagales bacterium]|nr:alpha-2-macroglobulin family protein [Chitinophagales bacterium]
MNYRQILLLAAILPAFGILVANIVADKRPLEPLPYSVGEPYTQDWKKVDSLVNLGLPQSALEIVKTIYAKANRSSNHAQIVKALLYREALAFEHQEAGLDSMIYDLEREVERAAFPVRPVMQSILAEIYWQFYQQNRYQILDRTITGGPAPKDIQTWDAQHFMDKVSQLYLASLNATDSLQRTQLDIFDSILITAPQSKIYRSSLYDFLAFRAANFFMGSESGITEPAYQFVIDEPKWFGLSEDFVRIKPQSPDSNSFKLKALLLLQQMTEAQLNYGSATSFVDLELQRLAFIHREAVLPEKDSLYLHALLKLEQRHVKDTISLKLSHAIAQHYADQASKYEAGKNIPYRWYYKNAIDKCNEALERFKKGGHLANNLLALREEVLQPSLEMVAEQVNTPKQPILTKLTYRNTDSVTIRVVHVKDKKLLSDIEGSDTKFELIDQLPAVASNVFALPATDDYQVHNIELPLNGLPIGTYYIIVSGKNVIKPISAYTRVVVSNIHVTSRQNNDQTQFFVSDRTSGQPLTGAQVKLYQRKYDYNLRKSINIPYGTYSTDKEGFCSAPKTSSNDYRNYQVAVFFKEDSLAPDNEIYAYSQGSNVEPKWEERTFFFLDRAIYRPGQTLYFKGLVLESKGKENRIKKKQSTTVELLDVNWQKVAEVKVTSNDFGTYSGTFTLPTGGLNGVMRVRTKSGSQSFRVEDYKRPRFEVNFDTLKGNYKLNETVTVQGFAKAYAGSNIDGAKVAYRVVRRARFPWWDYWGWGKMIAPSSPEMEVASGMATTDQQGNFIISFTAVPDKTIPESQLPEFTYKITADVTDLNGETRTGQVSITVGYVALQVRLGLKESYAVSDTQKVLINTQNLNGQFQAAQGTVQVFRLVDPGKLVRPRLWEAPDQSIMGEQDFRKTFPNDDYQGQKDFHNWKRGEVAFETVFNTANNPYLNLGLANWKQGAYVAEVLTHDAFGKEVRRTQYFVVYDPNSKSMPYTDMDWFVPINTIAQPGQTASLLVGTSALDAKVLYEVVWRGNIIKREWLTLSNEKKMLRLSIEERFRGGVEIRLLFVKMGRIFIHSHTIQVPYESKDLKLELATFRDKLSPGQQEQWKMKISGAKGEKVAAEMLASMYDASLDAFVEHQWSFAPPKYSEDEVFLGAWHTGLSIGISHSMLNFDYSRKFEYIQQGYDDLNWFIFPQYAQVLTIGFGATRSANYDMEMGFSNGIANMPGVKMKEADLRPVAPQSGTYSGADISLEEKSEEKKEDYANLVNQPVTPRRNFQETAFFYPHLQTDSTGSIIIAFTVPESLTRWKFQAFAHTQDLQHGLLSQETVTQKELMVMPDMPRFLREGDEIELVAKISNLAGKDLEGTAQLTLLDPYTMQPVNAKFGSEISAKAFASKKGQSTALSWKVKVPEGLGAVMYRITAQSGNFSDGEEAALPILSNRMLVTESLPLWVNGGQSKTFSMDKLLQSGKSNTLRHQSLTLEFSANPSWYAVQALPYLMEYPYECSEQLFNRYYANSLAAHTVKGNPRIKQVFDAWKSTDALVSNLEKNQELKSLLLEETPWVLEAKDETERKKRVALLFDMNRMANEQQEALHKLQKAQSSNGGWPWFKGMRDDRYITQYIVTGLGRLQQLGVLTLNTDNKLNNMAMQAVAYMDSRLTDDYNDLIQYKVKLEQQNISPYQAQYLYARSFFKEVAVAPDNQKAYNYYLGQAKQYWVKLDKNSQGMLALALFRAGEKATAAQIMASLRQTAITNEELGMYWKENTKGYYWYEAPVETQAVMIAAFDEVANDTKAVDELKKWLLKQKQVQDWKTTKATADACYALLVTGSEWLSSVSFPSISVGGTKINTSNTAKQPEIGTGYLKTTWAATEVKPEMGKVSITKADKGLAWGALYWQYFEQLDKITPAQTPLQINKQLYLQENTPQGPRITPITANSQLKPGDLVKVRIELRVDRDMEYVHMKDMRASGFEPVNVFSGYKYQGGLGYYESTRDAATDFFFDRLPKGTYVFEYPVRVAQKGNFSNGITNVQCMYAPEFGAHSEGIRVQVK